MVRIEAVDAAVCPIAAASFGQYKVTVRAFVPGAADAELAEVAFRLGKLGEALAVLASTQVRTRQLSGWRVLALRLPRFTRHKRSPSALGDDQAFIAQHGQRPDGSIPAHAELRRQRRC